eukprot:gene8786-734_t
MSSRLHAEFKNLALYFHWPFCKSICSYCDFNRYTKTIDDEIMLKRYKQIIQHFFQNNEKRNISSIFFGGGTPSLASPKTFYEIFNEIDKYSSIDESTEISMEANPTSIETEKLKEFRKIGVNRLSMGVQSLDENDLKFLEREHSKEDALKCIDLASHIFDKFSVDLIFGTPLHKKNSKVWFENLDEILKMKVSHISLYQLTIEKRTKMFKLFKENQFELPNEEESANLYEKTIEICKLYGLSQYEVSNFAKENFECKHNIHYWKCRDYLGIGPGAHSRITNSNNKRISSVQILNPNDWISKSDEFIDGNKKNEVLNESDRLIELIMMGMRVNTGISNERFKYHLNGKSFEDVLNINSLNLLKKEKLIDYNSNERLKVTKKGYHILDSIISYLIKDFKI